MNQWNSPAEQTQRPTYVFECNAFDTPWVVTEARVSETLSAPYSAAVHLLTGELGADANQLLGQHCALVMERGVVQHRVSGIVAHVSSGTTAADRVGAVVTIRPALFGLGQRRDTRVFQHKSVPDVLREVLEAGLQPYERTVLLELQEAYPVREYCVQYDETDLAFVSRLMEEEGIAYFFDQTDDAETLVLVDHPSKYRTVATLHERPLDASPVRNVVDGHEVIVALHLGASLAPTALTLRHYDWTRPADMLVSTKEAAPLADGEPADGARVAPAREVYQHDRDPLTLSEYDDARGFGAADGTRQAQVRRERDEQRATIFRVESTAMGMIPGATFEVEGHRMPELDGEYVVVTAEHTIAPGNGDGSHGVYRNKLTCARADITVRPARVHGKPVIPGLLTATVVGPAEQEIHTDVHGRIRVQFHWDRLGARNEHSSCFVRVVQPWAGEGWGFVFIPRIGMEVTVMFVEGDPDRPIVTGTVYNGANPTPYTLPDDMTRSVIRTRSTPSNGADWGYNELRFEDKAGGEEVFLRAEKDLTELVKNDHLTQVNGNQSNFVVGVHTVAIGMERSVSVGMSETITIGASRTETVEGPEMIRLRDVRDVDVVGSDQLVVHDARSVTVEGAQSGRYLAGRTVLVEAGDAETVAASDKSVTVEGKYEITVDDHLRVKRAGTELFVEEAVRATSPTEVELVVGGNRVALSSDGTITLTADSLLELVCGDARIALSSDGTVQISGTTKVELASGSSVFVVEPAKVATTSTQVDLDGSSAVNVKGGAVNLN
jgi:type VI secretion system secreted protein VgrG